MANLFEVIITRQHTSKEVAKNGKKEKGTLGRLVVWAGKTEIFSCYTMENSGKPTDKAGLDRPIIPRQYSLAWADSGVCVPPSYRQKGTNGRNKALWLKTPEVLGFANRRIMIHIGNDAIDTLGCILLGLGYNKESGKITESTKAVERFYNLCETHGVENFSLTIIGLDEEEGD
ncbi:DUF5675 family protein [Helicobacter mehlei]|uniref:DUF5675 domain-containing protein n=1 Tax=Helicobacter mehlei TaxID=2316080 RepID=A0A553UIU7_9HELI|nr:DUF5675 family protein [Helicobacter mehlei]TSA80116.1 hypothetical protein FNE76_07605 [Helicobacter mehlei]